LHISNKILQIIGIPHLALLSIIFGMMILSFPIGVFVVFNTNIGGDINFEYPIGFDLFGEIGYPVHFDFQLGDIFVALWSVYAIIFTISILGPGKEFLKSLSEILTTGKLDAKSNYMITITQWFSILILISAIIDFIQQGFGIVNVPPHADNNLTQFMYVSLSPIVEELSFRMILIGLPLFFFYSLRFSFNHFLNSLWNPSNNLHVFDLRKVFFLIVLSSVFFGFAHILSGEYWSDAKFAQATVSGFILGWLYFRFGLITSILVHWGLNYFIFSYVNFLSQINQITMDVAFSHPMINTMEVMFLISGAISLSILTLHYFYSKKPPELRID